MSTYNFSLLFLENRIRKLIDWQVFSHFEDNENEDEDHTHDKAEGRNDSLAAALGRIDELTSYWQLNANFALCSMRMYSFH